MKRNRVALLCMVAVLITLGLVLSSCGGNPLVGNWTHQSGSWIYFFGRSNIEFRSNNNVIGESGTGTWSTSGDTLTVNYGGNRYVFTYAIEDNVLVIADEDFDIGMWTKR